MEPRVIKVLKFGRGKAAESGGIALSGDGGFKWGCEIIELKQSQKKVPNSNESDTFFSGIIVL